MTEYIYATFEKTLAGLKSAFHVKHIATFEPIYCCPEDQVRSVFDRYPDYDQFPVKNNSRVIGVLLRNGISDAKVVADSMQLLDDAFLISSDTPLEEFVPLMRQYPYFRLVLDGPRITGVVTRSDLLKLPVRLLAFARIAQLEILMATIIDYYFGSLGISGVPARYGGRSRKSLR